MKIDERYFMGIGIVIACSAMNVSIKGILEEKGFNDEEMHKVMEDAAHFLALNCVEAIGMGKKAQAKKQEKEVAKA